MSSPNPEATWTELILLTQSVVQNLGLVYTQANFTKSLPQSQVYTFKFPTDAYRIPQGNTGTVVQYPCVQACLGRMEDVADNLQDFEDTQVIYPVLLVILFSANKSLALNNDLLYWRQQIYAAFEDFPDSLAGVVEEFVSDVTVFDCQITTQPVTDLMTWSKENYDFSWLILNYSTSRPRIRSNKG